MKRLSTLVMVCLGLLLLATSNVCAEQSDTTKILSIDYTKESVKQESLVVKLNQKAPFKIFTLGGDNPRLVVDFEDCSYNDSKVALPEDVELAVGIRTAVHRTPSLKTRIVIDLDQDARIKQRHKFIDHENHLKVILSGQTAAVAEDALVPVNNAVVKETESAEKIVKQEPVSAKRPLLLVPQILKISFDNSSNKGEMVLFHLNDFYPPAVSAIERGKPTVLCDFTDAKIHAEVNKDLVVQGKYVERISAVEMNNPNKVRVTLELVPDKDYDLQQVFFKNDNLFVLIVNELSAAKSNFGKPGIR